MAIFKPKLITFDCYGTLINFDMADATERCFIEHVEPEVMKHLIADFSRYRLDEVLGAWQPYYDVVSNALQRACQKWGIAWSKVDSDFIYTDCATWGAWPDVTAGLFKLAEEFPLLLLSNSIKDLLPHHIPRLGHLSIWLSPPKKWALISHLCAALNT